MAKTNAAALREHYEDTLGGLGRQATIRDIVEAIELHSGESPSVAPAKEDAPASGGKKSSKKSRR